MKFIGAIALPVLTLLLQPSALRATSITMSATYYTIAENDHDTTSVTWGTFHNEVQQRLGENGLPVLNTSAYGCKSGCFTETPAPTDVTANGQITWWSPAFNHHVTETSTGTVQLPFDDSTFYPPSGKGTNDANGYQAAIFSSTDRSHDRVDQLQRRRR